jgi:hypothetical protein
MQGSPLETDDLAAPPRRIPRQIVIIHWSLAVAALRKRLREPLAAPVLPSSAVLGRKRWCWFGQGGMKTIVRTRLRRFFATITYWHGNILRPTGEIGWIFRQGPDGTSRRFSGSRRLDAQSVHRLGAKVWAPLIFALA